MFPTRSQSVDILLWVFDENKSIFVLLIQWKNNIRISLTWLLLVSVGEKKKLIGKKSVEKGSCEAVWRW